MIKGMEDNTEQITDTALELLANMVWSRVAMGEKPLACPSPINISQNLVCIHELVPLLGNNIYTHNIFKTML